MEVLSDCSQPTTKKQNQERNTHTSSLGFTNCLILLNQGLYLYKPREEITKDTSLFGFVLIIKPRDKYILPLLI